MSDTYHGQWMHICEAGIEVYLPRATVKFCPYCGVSNAEFKTKNHGVEWGIDENLPIYTEDLLKIARLWSPDGEHTLEELIRDFANQLTGRLDEQLGRKD